MKLQIKRSFLFYTVLAIFGIKCLMAGYFMVHKEFLANLLHRIPLKNLELPRRGDRVLVFVPHPDDEIVGCCSFINKVIKNGCKLKVVMITNGDGIGMADQYKYWFFKPSPEKFQKLGYHRQRETKKALNLLGVSPTDLIFLGYPDRGSLNLWRENWDPDKPFTSKSTGYDHSFYNNCYTPGVKYTGSNLAGDFEKIIKDFSPTHIFYPHFYDGHLDHFITNNFVKYVLAKLDIDVKKYGYLVHRGNWPVPLGKLPQLPLLPPKALADCGIEWYSLDLSKDDLKKKEQCLRFYDSQLNKPIMGAYLYAFLRKNELFGEYAEHRDIELIMGLGREQMIPFVNPFADTLDAYLNQPADISQLTLFFKDTSTHFTLCGKIMTLAKPDQKYRYMIEFIFFGKGQSTKRAILVVENGTLEMKKLTGDSMELPEDAGFSVGNKYVSISLPLEKPFDIKAILVTATTFHKEKIVDRIGPRVIKIRNDIGN